MKIQLLKKQLLDAIIVAEKITGKKESLPVLSCILLDVDKDLMVRATNLESGIEVRILCDVQEPGVVAVSPSVVSQTLRSISGDRVTIYTEESNLYIESKGSKTLIKAIPHNEFPVLSRSQGQNIGVEVLRERFMKGVQSVSYAASPSMIRPELGSVYISLKSSLMVCVATDSFRLAEKNIPGVAGKDMGDLLIPLKHISELLFILEKVQSEKIQILIEDFQLTILGDFIRYVSRVVDANFPDYKTIIPKAATTEVTLLKADFSDVLKKGRVFSGNDQHIGLHVYPSKKIFSATARSQDVGEMSDILDAAVSGEDLDINFHIGYVADCLGAIVSDSITLLFAGPGRPLIMRGVGDASFMYLVMPLNR